MNDPLIIDATFSAIELDDNLSVAQREGHEVVGNLDDCHEGYCNVCRLSKAMILAAITVGTELAAAERQLGIGFPQFVKTRLPLNLPEARAMIDFAKASGLDPERLTPAHDVPLARLLDAVALLVATYKAVTSGTLATPVNNGAALDAMPVPDCKVSADSPTPADKPVPPDETLAETGHAVASSSAPVMSATTLPASDDTAASDGVPVENGDTQAEAGDVAALTSARAMSAVTATASEVVTDTSGEGSAGAGSVDGETIVSQPEITQEQRRFLAQRSVKLLLEVTHGEMTVEEAMRQAERLPIRKVR